MKESDKRGRYLRKTQINKWDKWKSKKEGMRYK